MTTPSEAIIEPDRPIIDPHHHLWDWPDELLRQLPFPDHGFSQMLRQKKRYLLDELLADLNSGHNVRATVFIECGAMYRAGGPEAFQSVGETEFVNGIAAMSASGLYGQARACACIVGHVDLRLAERAEDVLRAHIDAGCGRFRGIRHSASHDADASVLGPISGRAPEGLYRDPAFRNGFAALHRLGLTFDAWALEPQLPDVFDLARSYPDTAIILNHVGTPLGIGAYQGRRDERFNVWRDNIRALARCENIVVKLGGLAMPFAGFEWSCDHRPASSENLARSWQPYIETCIEAFGVDRCMFESNFPVDYFSGDYDTIWNAFKRLTADYSEPEKTALFSATAARVYSLDIET